MEVFYFLNITDLNNIIYGHKVLKEGEYANFIMKDIEGQKAINPNIDYPSNIYDNKINGIDKEIKF